MNRIYQGRVTRVERLKVGAKGNRLEDWEEFDSDPKRARNRWDTALWEHHELFQDAVNYYTLALAAMAEGVNPDTAQGQAALAWRAQVRDNWLDGRRKAVRYDGPHRRLAPWLGVDANIADEHAAFDACARAVLNDNGSTPAQRAAALLQLLEEAAKADLNQLCVTRLPFLCTEKGKFGATSKAVSSRQEVERQRLARRFRDLPDPQAIAQAPSLDLGLFLTQPPTEQVTGDDAVKMLRAYWGKAAKKFPALAPLEERFTASLAAAKDTLAVPSPGRKPSGLYPIAAVFRSFPCAETLAAFREATRSLCESKDKAAVADPLAEVRVGDAPVFDYFTNRAFHRAPNDPNRAVWFEFDLAAFIEAIKAPHRYFQDTQKREQDADKLRARIAAMEQQGAPDTDADGDSGAPFGFADDQRIALLRELVTDPVHGLAYLAETEGIAPGPAEYTIQERTLRGWNAIRDPWRALAEKGEATPEKLWAVVASEQAAHRDDFGSATLYKKLAEPRYHPIWRDKGSRPWHADDPLRAWLQYTELRFELADKTRPIRFTPAHAVHSPRYFIFPKKSAAGGRWGSEHEIGALAFTAGIAICDGAKWRPQMVRITYAAPRLRRDELRRPEEKSLDAAPWLQPMMKALGLPEPPQQDFGNCRITLQPASPDDIQLTFPVEVAPARLIAHVGKQSRWSRQFNVTPDGDEFRDATLRWPHEKKPGKPPTPWHDALDAFCCLAVDLGQREAGAFALLEVCANHDFGRRPSRFLGETPGKQWRAALAASGLLRLSGEDRQEWRARTSKDTDDGETFALREELHGSRGRMPRAFETQECRELLDAFLGAADPKTFLPPGWDDPQSPARLSFPEQNDKLLVAARRAQSRLNWLRSLKPDHPLYNSSEARAARGEPEE